MNLIKYLLGIDPHKVRVEKKKWTKGDRDDFAWTGAKVLMIIGGVALLSSLLSFIHISDTDNRIKNDIQSIEKWKTMRLSDEQIEMMGGTKVTESASPLWYLLRAQGGWAVLAISLCFLSTSVRRHIVLSMHKTKCDAHGAPHRCKEPKSHRLYHVAGNLCECLKRSW